MKMYLSLNSANYIKMKGKEAGENSNIIYFGSEDCSAEEKRIKDTGGKIYKPKQSIREYGFMVLAYDTEGNLFGVYSES